MDSLFNVINFLFDFWIEADWYLALLISVAVNTAVFLITSALLEALINYMVRKNSFFAYIDDRDLRPEQRKTEIKNGVLACTIFSIGSLLSRELFTGIWPHSLSSLFYQIASFVIFYETYSYFVHRLLHLPLFTRVHGVHHQSIRTTPWTAYSVHPIEATFIGMSAPIFMVLFPLSLGVALVLHVMGMMFTIFLHSNFTLKTRNSTINNFSFYPNYHSSHHLSGNINFGFVAPLWDRFFRTLT